MTGLIELALNSLSLYVVVDVAILVPLLPCILDFVYYLGLNCLYLLCLCKHSIREGQSQRVLYFIIRVIIQIPRNINFNYIFSRLVSRCRGSCRGRRGSRGVLWVSLLVLDVGIIETLCVLSSFLRRKERSQRCLLNYSYQLRLHRHTKCQLVEVQI